VRAGGGLGEKFREGQEVRDSPSLCGGGGNRVKLKKKLPEIRRKMSLLKKRKARKGAAGGKNLREERPKKKKKKRKKKNKNARGVRGSRHGIPGGKDPQGRDRHKGG